MNKTKKPVQKRQVLPSRWHGCGGVPLAYRQRTMVGVRVFVFYFLRVSVCSIYIIKRYKAITPITTPTANSTFFNVLLIAKIFLKSVSNTINLSLRLSQDSHPLYCLQNDYKKPLRGIYVLYMYLLSSYKCNQNNS